MLSAEFSDRVTSYLLCLLTSVGFCTRCNFHTKAYSIVRMGIRSWCELLYFRAFTWAGFFFYASFSN